MAHITCKVKLARRIRRRTYFDPDRFWKFDQPGSYWCRKRCGRPPIEVTSAHKAGGPLDGGRFVFEAAADQSASARPDASRRSIEPDLTTWRQYRSEVAIRHRAPADRKRAGSMVLSRESRTTALDREIAHTEAEPCHSHRAAEPGTCRPCRCCQDRTRGSHRRPSDWSAHPASLKLWLGIN